MSARARCGVGAVALVLSAACSTPSSSGGRHTVAQPASLPPSRGASDVSYDWHGLILAPFGTLLKDSPVPLHEVLLFRDEGAQRNVATGAASSVPGKEGGGVTGAAATGNTGGPNADIDKDCYAIDGTPPRFAGHRPDRYVMCFDHDRLSRIEASVSLTAEEAPQVFADACARWSKNPPPAAAVGHTCEGRDGGIVFSARLALTPGEAVVPLSMTLSGAADAPHVP